MENFLLGDLVEEGLLARVVLGLSYGEIRRSILELMMDDVLVL